MNGDLETPHQNTNTPSSEPSSWHSPQPPVVSHHNHGHDKRPWWKLRKPQTKKEWAIVILVAIVIIAALVAAYYTWFRPGAKPNISASKKAASPVVKAEPLTSKLTGLPISDASINQRPVTAIMVENSTFARPQSGIDQAGVVFEAVAEGGITRFLTLFQDSDPAYVGPVRSVRPYYIQWLMGFDAAVAHVGGSGEALQDLKDWGTKNLDQFYNPAPYHRISSRYAPHNMYTSVPALRQLEAKKGYGAADYKGFARKAEAPSKTPNATTIDFAISGAAFNAHFEYDTASNSYKRWEGGEPHMVVDEAGNKKQLSPKNVVALVMPKGQNGIYSTYNTIGSGQAVIFQDGVATAAAWHKPDRSTNFTFTDPSSGAILKLNPGQTWLTALGSMSSISYK